MTVSPGKSDISSPGSRPRAAKLCLPISIVLSIGIAQDRGRSSARVLRPRTIMTPVSGGTDDARLDPRLLDHDSASSVPPLAFDPNLTRPTNFDPIHASPAQTALTTAKYSSPR